MWRSYEHGHEHEHEHGHEYEYEHKSNLLYTSMTARGNSMPPHHGLRKPTYQPDRDTPKGWHQSQKVGQDVEEAGEQKKSERGEIRSNIVRREGAIERPPEGERWRERDHESCTGVGSFSRSYCGKRQGKTSTTTKETISTA